MGSPRAQRKVYCLRYIMQAVSKTPTEQHHQNNHLPCLRKTEGTSEHSIQSGYIWYPSFQGKYTLLTWSVHQMYRLFLLPFFSRWQRNDRPLGIWFCEECCYRWQQERDNAAWMGAGTTAGKPASGNLILRKGDFCNAQIIKTLAAGMGILPAPWNRSPYL